MAFCCLSRSEDVTFTFEVGFDRLNDVREFMPVEFPMYPGDRLKCDYHFSVDYYGDIVTKFNKLIELMDNGIIVKANISEANYGRMLIKDILDRLDKIIEKVNAK